MAMVNDIVQILILLRNNIVPQSLSSALCLALVVPTSSSDNVCGSDFLDFLAP